MAVVDVGIGDHVHKLARVHVGDLRHHHEQDGVLAHVPVVCRKHVLAALDQEHVERGSALARLLRHVVDGVVGTGIQVHLGEVRECVEVGHDAA